jgi:hypothetical protein
MSKRENEKVAVFAYGSLMIPDSASRAIGRDVQVEEMRPALLRGYRRVWRARVPVWSDNLQDNIACVFLDLRPAPGRFTNGLLIDVDEQELAHLRLREAQYGEADVSSAIVPPPNSGRVITFAASSAFRRNLEGLKSYISTAYAERVARACQAIGPEFLEEFNATTEQSRLPRFEGSYRFIDPEQSKRV